MDDRMNAAPVTNFIPRPAGHQGGRKKIVTKRRAVLSFLVVWIVLALHG
jgi:hypothetical protein